MNGRQRVIIAIGRGLAVFLDEEEGGGAKADPVRGRGGRLGGGHAR